MQMIVITRTFNCVYFNFLTVWSAWLLDSNWSVSAYGMLNTYGKCAEITFIMEEFSNPVRQQQSGWYVTVILNSYNLTNAYTSYQFLMPQAPIIDKYHWISLKKCLLSLN
jgi:hypothetical protein